jgi:hypothetical protein
VDVALLGRDAGLFGSGPLVKIHFRVKAEGEAALTLKHVDARDGANHNVALGVSPQSVTPALPSVTSFAPVRPNPFRGTTTLGFALAKFGAVELAVYGVDGRKIVTLVKETRAPGRYPLTWDGRDAARQAVRPGVYYARLSTPQGRFTRTLVLMK